jgi:hypothetical protein
LPPWIRRVEVCNFHNPIRPIRRSWNSLDSLTFCVLGSKMLSANMGRKIFIAPPLVVLLHFIERLADGCSRRIEHPSAFGATPALKTLFFDPSQFALHGLLSTPSDLLRTCASSAVATTNAALSIALSDVPPKSPVFEHCKPELNTQGPNINDRKRLLSVGYPTFSKLPILTRGRPQTVE